MFVQRFDPQSRRFRYFIIITSRQPDRQVERQAKYDGGKNVDRLTGCVMNILIEFLVEFFAII